MIACSRLQNTRYQITPLMYHTSSQLHGKVFYVGCFSLLLYVKIGNNEHEGTKVFCLCGIV